MDPLTLMLIGTAASGGLTKLLNPGKGYKKGQEQLNQYYNQGQNYLQPYAQHGEEAYGNLQGAMQKLLNPSAFHDELLGNYKQSDASKFAQNRALNSGLTAAQAQGLGGSSAALQAIQGNNAQIGAEDEQRYIERMIQQYVQGAGIAQNIYSQGSQAAGQQSQNALTMGQLSGQSAFGQQNAPGELFSKLLGTLGSLGTGAYGLSQLGQMGQNNGVGTPPFNPAGTAPQMKSPWSTTGRY